MNQSDAKGTPRVSVSFERVADADLISEENLAQVARLVLDGEDTPFHELGIVLTGHDQLRQLNSRFLGHDYNTDVLSFLIDESVEGIEGEVYVDVDMARERCSEFDASLEEEILRYVIHGLLHLTGHKDDTPKAKERMNLLESKYLRQFSGPS